MKVTTARERKKEKAGNKVNLIKNQNRNEIIMGWFYKIELS
jgi:hypothetical protein